MNLDLNKNELRQFLPLRLQVATAFVLLMWLFFSLYQPWQPIGNDLLHGSGSFDDAGDLSGWQREQGRLNWSDGTGYVSLQERTRVRYSLPAIAGDMLSSSGKIQTSDLKAGKRPWDAGRILVYFEDAKGNVRWSHPHNVGFLSGTNDWQLFSTLIDVPSYATRGWVELAHFGKSGTVDFDDISIQPAEWKPAYQHWQMFFGMLWAAILMWLILNTHFWTLPGGKSVLVSGLVIVIGVTLPPATMFQVAKSGAEISKTVISQAGEVFTPDANKQVEPIRKKAVEQPEKTQTTKIQKSDKTVSQQTAARVTEPETAPRLTARTVQKTGHTLLFALLGFFAFRCFSRTSDKTLVIYSLLLFAFATEVLQLVVDGRLFGLADFLLDAGGIGVGGLIGWLWYHIRPALKQV